MQVQSNRLFTLKLLVEVFLIILGVLLGLFFNEMRLQQRSHDRAQAALLQINNELHYNRAQVAEIADHHIVVLDSLSVLMSRNDNLEGPISLQEVISVVPGGFGFVRLQKHGWSLAMELGVVENMDYQIATELSRVYSLQERYLETYDYLAGSFFVASNLSVDCREGLVMGLFLLASNITHLEEDLLATYDEVIEQIEESR